MFKPYYSGDYFLCIRINEIFEMKKVNKLLDF